MANYYTQFNTIIPMSDEAKEWAIDLYERLCCLRDDEPMDNPLAASTDLAKDLYEDYADPSGGLGFECSDDRDGLWLYVADEDSVNQDLLFDFIQCILREFDIKDPVVIDFIHSCSRLGPDSAHGSACVISQKEIAYHHTHDWVSETAKRMCEEQQGKEK